MKSLQNTLSQQFSYAWQFVVVKPGFIQLASDIINRFKDKGWKMTRITTKQLTLREARRLYLVHKQEDFYDNLCKYMSSDLSVGIIFEKPGAFVGKEMFKETEKIKEEIREKWGKDDMRNVLHSSDTLSAMEHESEIYF